MQFFDPNEHTYFVQCSATVAYNGPMDDESVFAHVENAFPTLADVIEEFEEVGENLIRFIATGKVYSEDLGALRDMWEDDHPNTRHLIHSVKNVVFDNELIEDVLAAEHAARPRFITPTVGEVAA